MTCPNIKSHAKVSEGYVARSEWMEKKHRAGYRQERCIGCRLFVIWKKPQK